MVTKRNRIEHYGTRTWVGMAFLATTLNGQSPTAETIENFSTTPNTIDMMLCMGHVPVGTEPGTQVLRIFPVWPKKRDARFVDLRTWGAFLVSSELTEGRVQFVRIQSERGRACTVVNPWPGEPVAVQQLDGSHQLVHGERFTLATTEGETLLLRPGAR